MPAVTRETTPRFGHSLIIAILAGAVSVGGFAPLALASLAVLGLACLILLWQYHPSPTRAAGLGLAFGLGHFGTGVSWVYVSLHDIGGMAAPIAAIATALFCGVLALYPALAGFALAWLRQRWPTRRGWSTAAILIAPAAWVLAEWLRSWLFTGFPWLGMGYSQTDTPLAGFAPVLGVFGVSLITTILAAAIAHVIARARQKPPNGGGAPVLRWLGPLLAVLTTLAIGHALRQIAWSTPTGTPVTVALAQGNIPQSLKFEPGRFESTLHTYQRLVASGNAQLTVLPETAIPRFLDQTPVEYLVALEQLARERKGNILIGVPLRDRAGRYTNSVISLGEAQTQSYHKTHLVPFGEFIPSGFGWILDWLRIPLADFTPGRPDAHPLRLGESLQVAVNICYEDAFGGEIARQLPQANLLANVSNVAWFGDSLAPEQHLQISRMRAMETGRYLIRATNTGVTAIIDAQGAVKARLPGFTEGLLQGEIQPHVGATPYVKLGDAPVILFCALLFVAGVVGNRASTVKSRIQ